MLFVVLIQTLLPVLLIVWFAFLPAKSLTGYTIQFVATALVLTALLLASLWMIFPWWIPIAYGGLLVLVLVIRLWRRGFVFAQCWPNTVSAWLGVLLLIALGGVSTIISWQAIQGRQLPGVGVVDLPLPFRSGLYLVANGGSQEIVNGHMLTLNPEIERFRAYIGQSYGVDLVKINFLGLRAKGLLPEDPSAYAIYNEPVFAPCNGEVIASRNDRPDMPVPTMDREVMEGNHVMLSCHDYELLLAHFRPGSVQVSVGDRVSVGQLLGYVGNSGNSSEPHLHISAQLPGDKASPISGQPLGITFNGVFPVRNDRIRATGNDW